MNKLAALTLATVCFLAIAAAGGRAAGCSPIDCAPGASSLGHHLLGVRPAGLQGPVRVLDLQNGKTRWTLPAGVLTGTTLVHQDGTLLTWFNAATGARVADATVQLRGDFQLSGTSADGKLAVLVRTQKRQTTFAVVGPRSARSVTLAGHFNWGFDALSGTRLYLLQYLQTGYEVRLYDLAQHRLFAQPLKDAHESALIQGSSWERLASPDGRYLFTLYIGSHGGSMIHELDLRAATARCIDLPGSGDFNSATAYGLAVSPDGTTLWAASTGYGVVVAIDIASAKLRETFHFSPSTTNSPVAPAVALSPRGDLFALAFSGDVFVADLKTRHVRRQKPHVAIAIGFSPDARRLWLVGERSRVSALSLR